MLLEIGLKSSFGEFSTIIRTKNFYLGRAFSLNHGMKCLKNGENFFSGF